MFSREKVAMIVAEVFGTFVLTMSVLAVSHSPIGLGYFVSIAAGLTLAVLVLTVGATSGAHVNPAVTLGMWTIRKIDTAKAVVYIAAQFLGAALAWRLYVYLMGSTLQNTAGKFDWHVLVAEVVGTAIFTFGIAAAVFQKYEGGRLAATIGASLTIGILAASMVSNGLLNPALALGTQSWNGAYVGGPIIGAIVGMNLYALLFADKAALKTVLAPVTVKKSAKKTKK